MHIVDPVRFFIFLVIISALASPMCTGVIGCEEYPDGYFGEGVCD